MMYKREGKNIKPEEKSWKGFSCQHDYSTARLETWPEKYFEALQAQYRQYIYICVVKGEILSHLTESCYHIGKAPEMKGY